MDADLSHDPTYIPEFFKAFAEGNDYVIGYHYVPEAAHPTALPAIVALLTAL